MRMNCHAKSSVLALLNRADQTYFQTRFLYIHKPSRFMLRVAIAKGGRAVATGPCVGDGSYPATGYVAIGDRKRLRIAFSCISINCLIPRDARRTKRSKSDRVNVVCSAVP